MGLFDIFKSKSQHSTFELSDLIEIIQDGICIAKHDGVLIYANPAAYNLLEISPDNPLDAYNFYSSFIQEPKIIGQIQGHLQHNGMLKNLELQLHTTKDVKKDVILNANVLGDYTQDEYAVLFLFKDVTEIKLIQQQLLQSQKLESVGLMASGIAHDFNNILAAIIPNAELIKIHSPKGSENYHRAVTIEKSAARATEIANRLLTFTRNQENYREWVYLNDIVRSAIEMVRSSMPGDIQILTDLTEDLYMLYADPTQMEQILINLMLNSRDAMPDGGTIFIETENETINERFQHMHLEPGKYIKLTVRDTGSGIPPEIISKIFDPFFTTKEVGKGTGLGLSMVYGIVHNHHGNVFVNSQVGKGTEFTIYLPAGGKKVQPAEEPEEEQILSPNHKSFLIIDDEQNVREVLGDILRFLGHVVFLADSGPQGIKIYKNHQEDIDYVILDMRMPKMDGRATLAELRKINPGVKVIATSGFDASNEKTYKELGLIGFLKKPYNIQRLSSMLAEIFENEQADA